MGNRVYYHHPENEQYSLAYVTQERAEITNTDPDGIIEHCDCDQEFYILYTNGDGNGTVEDIDTDFEDVLADMSAANRTIAIRLLQIFETIVEEKQTDESETLTPYKQIELENIPKAIDSVQWKGSTVEVAGRLMSSLILKHPLPNANHRTAIGMAQWYLESLQTEFSFPVFATENRDWIEWVDEYIIESKRILTVRRNTTAFSLLSEWGCNVVTRKGGIEIDLASYVLDLPESEAYEYYGDQHTELCIEFVAESVKRAGHDELLGMDGIGKSDFVRYLQVAE